MIDTNKIRVAMASPNPPVTQQFIAEESGLSKPTVRGICNGTGNPGIQVLEKFAVVLGLTAKDILTDGMSGMQNTSLDDVRTPEG